MTEEKRTLEAVRNAVKEEDNTITLSTGVKLRGKTVAPNILISAMAAFPRPKPPLWRDPNLGRMVENPDDPDYIKQVQSMESQQADVMLNIMIVYGTELDSVPNGFSRPFPEEKSGKKQKAEGGRQKAEGGRPDWLRKYALLGLPTFEEDRDWLYLTWVKTEAALKKEDNESIQKMVGKLSGVPERDVQAAETFSGSDS